MAGAEGILEVDEDEVERMVKIIITIRAGKSESLIRWKRLKGRKRRKKAEKANLIYN